MDIMAAGAVAIVGVIGTIVAGTVIVVRWRDAYTRNRMVGPYRWAPAEPPWGTAILSRFMVCPHPDGFVEHHDDFIRGIGRCLSCGLIRPGGGAWAIITPTPIGYVPGAPVTHESYVGWAIMHTAPDRVPDRFYTW